MLLHDGLHQLSRHMLLRLTLRRFRHAHLHGVLHQHALVKDTMQVCMTKAAQSKPKQHVSAELMQAIVQQHDSAAASSDWLAERNVCLLLVMMLGMLRESEAVELRMEDIHVRYEGAPEQAVSVSMLIRQSK